MPFFFLTGILCFFVDLNKAKVTGLKKKKNTEIVTPDSSFEE